MKGKLLLLLLLGELPPVHSQIPWKLEPFLEYFGTVRGSVLGARVKGFVGSHSNNPYNVAVTEGYNLIIEDPRLLFYHISTPQDTTPRWIIPGANNVEHGDCNGDGLTDFAVRKSVSTDRNDTVLVFLGNPTGIDTIPTYKLPAEQERSAFGRNMCVGDINNDGISDLIVTAENFRVKLDQGEQGKVYIYYGKDSLSDQPALTITGRHPGARLGSRSAVADFNCDGFNDLVVRGCDATVQNSFFGYLKLYFGSAAFDTVADLTAPRSYRTIVDGLVAFDANADGKADLLWTYSDSLTSQKFVYIHFGGSDFAERFRAKPDFVIPAPFGSGDFGNEIANAGDMNGDGDNDIVIGAYTTGQNNGLVFVYTAGKALDDEFDAAKGQSLDGAFGSSLDGVGDINRDGYSDIIIGAPNQPWLRHQGYFGIFKGDSRIPTGIARLSTETLPSAFALLCAHPNPFKHESNIQFNLPQPAIVKIKVYSILGKEVMTLLDSEQFAGQQQVSWNGRDKNGEIIPSGIYLVRMQAFSRSDSRLLFEQTNKLTVVR